MAVELAKQQAEPKITTIEVHRGNPEPFPLCRTEYRRWDRGRKTYQESFAIVLGAEVFPAVNIDQSRACHGYSSR